jgi:hypothetical protein
MLGKELMCFGKISTNGRDVVLAMPAPFTLSLSKGGAGFFGTEPR